jgi:hypothetical protein
MYSSPLLYVRSETDPVLIKTALGCIKDQSPDSQKASGPPPYGDRITEQLFHSASKSGSNLLVVSDIGTFSISLDMLR